MQQPASRYHGLDSGGDNYIPEDKYLLDGAAWPFGFAAFHSTPFWRGLQKLPICSEWMYPLPSAAPNPALRPSLKLLSPPPLTSGKRKEYSK